MQYLYIDLETIPAQRPDVIAEITEAKQAQLVADIAAIRPPGNIKKAETIDAWMRDEYPEKVQALTDAVAADIDETYRKTSLDGAFGQVAVIGFAFDDGPAESIYKDDWENPASESRVLAEFSDVLADTIPMRFEQSMCVVGHNVSGFDLRFLIQRHIINCIRPHRVISAAAQAKPWEANRVYDTMIQWAGTGGRVKLDKLCKALSVPSSKGLIDGSKVWDYVRDGRINEVAEYCKLDVLATREVHKRMMFSPSCFEDVGF